MQIRLLLALALLPLTSLAAVDWNALLNSGDSARVTFGTILGGNAAFARNPDQPFTPASNAKLFTAGLALATLGPDFQFTTRLEWQESAPGKGSELTLIGGGDPSWGMKEFGETFETHFDLLAKALFDHGLRELEGPITLASADPRWNELDFPEGWQPEDISSCDGALAQAFNLNVNCANFILESPGRGHWQEPGMDFPVEIRLSAGSETKVEANYDHSRRVFVLSGSWKQGSAPHDFMLPVHNTHAWIRNLFEAALARQGIKLQGPSSRNSAPGSRQSLELKSPPLSELLKPFLKNSVNFLGDSLLKAVGARTGGSTPLREAGLMDLRTYISSQKVAGSVELFDGSGLSRSSKVSPRALFAYLEALMHSRDFSAIWEALPIAGVDGTLEKRMKGTPAMGVLRAKTGTLDGVYNLSGYVPVSGGFVPFVLLSSTTPDLENAARSAEDRVGAQLTAILRGPGLKAGEFEPGLEPGIAPVWLNP
jgi:serine-type D-Ala-D-Ala carboxypeptidase/endopeptidase (penicillin-binding protein 4)